MDYTGKACKTGQRPILLNYKELSDHELFQPAKWKEYKIQVLACKYLISRKKYSNSYIQLSLSAGPAKVSKMIAWKSFISLKG